VFFIRVAETPVFKHRVERLAFGPTPGGIIDGRLIRTPYFNWGWNCVVSSTSSYPEIAYLFTLFASSPAMSTASVRDTGGYFVPSRGRHYEDKHIREAYSPEFLAAHEDSMRNSIPDLYLKGQVEYFDELRLNIKAADAGTKSPKQALDDTVATWNGITERMGKRSQLVQWLYLKSAYPTRLRGTLV
jgi:multiple sugar transport system substrate-binding protein